MRSTFYIHKEQLSLHLAGRSTKLGPDVGRSVRMSRVRIPRREPQNARNSAQSLG